MVTLCDLDAAAPIGQVRGKDLKCSTAYCPPEHVKALVSGDENEDAAMEVKSEFRDVSGWEHDDDSISIHLTLE